MAHVAEMKNADQQMNAMNMIEYVWMPISSNLQFPSFWPIHTCRMNYILFTTKIADAFPTWDESRRNMHD